MLCSVLAGLFLRLALLVLGVQVLSKCRVLGATSGPLFRGNWASREHPEGAP